MPAGYRKSVSRTGSPWNAPYICRWLLIPAPGGPYTKLTSEALKETREEKKKTSAVPVGTKILHLDIFCILYLPRTDAIM